MQGLFVKRGGRGNKLSAEETSIEDAEGMDENMTESVDDTDKADGFKEREEDVGGVVEAKGTRPALQHCRNIDKTATK